MPREKYNLYNDEDTFKISEKKSQRLMRYNELGKEDDNQVQFNRLMQKIQSA